MTILDKAAEVTGGDRSSIYGHPLRHFTCTAGMVTHYLIRRGWTPPPGEQGLLPEDWAQLMTLEKTSRQAGALVATGRIHEDTAVDQAGYARTAEMVDEAKHHHGLVTDTTSTRPSPLEWRP
jgi:hypothetical protein